jgi:hypothetical protein
LLALSVIQATLFEAFALHVYENLARSPKNFAGLARLQLLIRFKCPVIDFENERTQVQGWWTLCIIEAVCLTSCTAGVAERNIYQRLSCSAKCLVAQQTVEAEQSNNRIRE